MKYSPFAAHISAGHPMLVKYLSCHSESKVSRKITFSFPLIINAIRSNLRALPQLKYWNIGVLEYWFWPPACRAYRSER